MSDSKPNIPEIHIMDENTRNEESRDQFDANDLNFISPTERNSLLSNPCLDKEGQNPLTTKPTAAAAHLKTNVNFKTDENNNPYIYPSRVHGSHITVNDTRYEDSPDGGWGWAIVAAVWIDNMCVLGMLKSFPVLYSKFKEEDWTDGNQNLNFRVSLISSIALSMRASCAPLAAFLTNRYNERIVVFIGGLMVITGLILSSQATAIYQLYIYMGIISGCGFALSSMPALALIGRYFSNKRALANGISRSGGGAFFFLSPLLAYLSENVTFLDYSGWQVTLLFCAMIEILICCVALIFKPINLKSELKFDRKGTMVAARESQYAENVLKQKSTKSMLKHSIDSGQSNSKIYENLTEAQLKNTKTEVKNKVLNEGISESMIIEKFPTIEPVYQPTRRSLDFKLMADPLWIMCTLNLVLTQFAYSGCLIHMTARTNSVIEDPKNSINKSTIMTIVGICEIISQLIAASVGDKQIFTRIQLHQIYITIMTLATFASVILPQNLYVLMFSASLLGLGAGAWQANILPVTADTLGVIKLRSAYGLCLFFSGVCGQLVGAPFIGLILDIYAGNSQKLASENILKSDLVAKNLTGLVDSVDSIDAKSLRHLDQSRLDTITGYKISFAIMGIILIVAILILQLEPAARKYVEQQEAKKILKEKLSFQVTDSIAIDLNTLLAEFPRTKHYKSSDVTHSFDSKRGSINLLSPHFALSRQMSKDTDKVFNSPPGPVDGLASNYSIYNLDSRLSLAMIDELASVRNRKGSAVLQVPFG